jgi:hypothetical protein
MATETKRCGYATEDAAVAAAKRMGRFGLTGSGQQCLAIELPDRSFAFWTAHNFFHPDREPGELLFPGGREAAADDTAGLLRIMAPISELELVEFLRDDLGISEPFHHFMDCDCGD